jgi:hypothetical protein
VSRKIVNKAVLRVMTPVMVYIIVSGSLCYLLLLRCGRGIRRRSQPHGRKVRSVADVTSTALRKEEMSLNLYVIWNEQT